MKNRRLFAIIALCILMASMLVGATVTASASNVGQNIEPIRGNVMPYIVNINTEVGDYEYYFYDTIYTNPNGIFDIQTISYSGTDDIATYYVVDTTIMLDDNQNIYVRFYRDYGSYGFIYNVDTTELITDVDRMESYEDGNGDFIISYRIGNSTWYETDLSNSFIIGTMDFQSVEEIGYLDNMGVETIEEERHKISVQRWITSIGCTFTFSGLGLFDSEWNPYDITIIDDNAYYNTDTERPLMRIYNDGVPTNTVYDIRAVADKIEVDDDGIAQYYQTYQNTYTAWDYDNYHALPTLQNNKIYNISLPEYDMYITSNDYLKLSTKYEYVGQDISSYFALENHTLPQLSQFRITGITFGAPVDESAPYKTILPWGWLDLEMKSFDLVTFLNTTTEFLFIDIIGVFSIADIIAIVIGISLLFAFLKLYLGG